MLATTTTSERCRAPCGQIEDGEHYREQDDEYLVADNMYFPCGCRIIVHEFPDGSFQRKVIHHNGTLLVDELVAEHHP